MLKVRGRRAVSPLFARIAFSLSFCEVMRRALVPDPAFRKPQCREAGLVAHGFCCATGLLDSACRLWSNNGHGEGRSKAPGT